MREVRYDLIKTISLSSEKLENLKKIINNLDK
jgi:hypothetical protein